MGTETKSRTLHYKMAKITKSSKTLQQMLENQLVKKGASLSLAKKREEPLSGNEDGAFRILNEPKKHQGMFFAQLMRWEKDKSQSTITIKDSAKSYSIRMIKTGDIRQEAKAKKEKEEFLESVLYFGVLDNHLVLLSSQSLNARQLETHLSWLLGTQSKELPSDGMFILQDQPTKEAREKLENSPARKVSFGSPIVGELTVDEDNNKMMKSTSAKSIQYIPTGVTGELIAALFKQMGAPVPKLQDALDDANLQLKLEVTYLRQTTKSGQQFLDSLSTSLRHAHEEDVSVSLANGTKLKGKDIKLSTDIRVAFNDGIIDDNELYHQMHNWMVSLINNDSLND